MFFKLLVFWFQTSFLLADPIVQLPNGLIRGREATTLENKQFYAFHGIPYAAPPVGELRFKAPQPAADWEGTRDATQVNTICFQRSGSGSGENESEDCLFIDVFTPQLPSENNNVSLPVMLWIHGGGFIAGSGVNAGADLFINNDVILASINYRLGIFGFISTLDEIIPGNNGLKDQQLAIEWTHNNIHLFGGDPDKITIFGQSAGSASCAYQLLNQKNNGLFQGAILESGSFLNPWTLQRRAREIAFTTASYLNSTFEDSDDSQALLNFLMTLDAKDLAGAALKYYNMNNDPFNVEITQGFFFAPVVEVKNPDAFLTKKMYGLLKSGNVVKVPILIGITSEESVNQDPDIFLNMMTEYDEHLDWLVPDDMGISVEEKRTEMGSTIRDLYTGGEPFVKHLGDGIRYFSDNSFTRSVIRHGEFFSKLAETYFYVFSYDGELTHINTSYDGAEKVGHAEEVTYLFCSGTGCDHSAYPKSDDVTSQRLVKLWTNFAKYQNPTPEPSELLQNITWPMLTTDDGEYIFLDINEDLEIKSHPKKTYDEWVKIYDSLDNDDFDTY